MNTSALYPPNLRSFSDQVIRNVVQRVDYSRRDLNIAPVSLPVKQELHFGAGTDYSSLTAVGHVKRVAGQTAADSNRRGRPSRHSSTDQPGVSSSLSFAERALERRRQQSRVNMARYRKKMVDRVADLEDSIQQLREETYKLELQRQLLDFGISTTRTSWNVVSDFFRLFRYALKEPGAKQSSHSSVDALRSQHLQVHRAFLVAAMAPDLITAWGCGIETLLEGYRRISLYFPDLDVQLESLKNSFEDTTIATTKSKATFSECTLRSAFPHLVQDPELWASLGSRLLGRTVVMRGSVRFIWDGESGRIASLYYTADLLTPVLELLGDMGDVSRVFEHALVSPDGNLVSDANSPRR